MPIDQLELLLEDPAVRDALAVVYERSDGGTEELDWSDVKDALSSGQWGRLIEEGILVSAGSGFVLANPDRLQTKLDEQDGLDGGHTDEIESESWSPVDKAAGAFALLLFAGYWSTHLRNVIASIENVVLGALADLVPFYGIVLLLAVVTGLYSTILQARLMDHEKLQQYQQRMQQLKERKQAAKERDDQEALEQIQEEQMEAMGDQLGMFKVQFRPTVWIMLLTIPVFLWLRWKVRGGHLGPGDPGLILPIAGAVGWQDPLVGPIRVWIGWYFLGSMLSRQLIKKTLNLQSATSS
jgi:uncharacterized membrane protein (DUF106 family)